MLNVCMFRERHSIPVPRHLPFHFPFHRNAKVFTQRDLKFSYHILISSSIKCRCKFGAKLFLTIFRFFIHFIKSKELWKNIFGSISFVCLSFNCDLKLFLSSFLFVSDEQSGIVEVSSSLGRDESCLWKFFVPLICCSEIFRETLSWKKIPGKLSKNSKKHFGKFHFEKKFQEKFSGNFILNKNSKNISENFIPKKNPKKLSRKLHLKGLARVCPRCHWSFVPNF